MLIILTTHPIQYQVPLWQVLARDGRVPFEVWYLTRHGVEASHDREFGKSFAWDLDMSSGYRHRFFDGMENAPPNSFWKCRLRDRLRDRLRASGAKALWVQGWQTAAYWQAVWEAKAAGVEVWLRGESNDLAPVPPWKRGVKRVILGQFFRRVNRFLCIGTANKRLYQKFGLPESRLYPAPYAVDNERFARQAETVRGQRSVVRGQWNISDDAFCVLFCGKFIPKKRPLDLVAAVHILTAENAENVKYTIKRPMHLLFVGSGELGAPLRASTNVVLDAESPSSQPSTLNYQLPRATFAGFLNQTEIARAYAAADCLVLPSDYGETWGLVVNEAMASGLPCVISDQCGCAEDLGTAPNAVFPCGDVAELADCLSKIAGRKEYSVRPSPTRQPPSLDETVATVISVYESRR